MFIYQPLVNMLELIKNKSTDYVIDWKSEGLLKSKILPLHDAFLSKTKYFRCKIGMQFNNNSLVLKQNKQLHNKNCRCLHCLRF